MSAGPPSGAVQHSLPDTEATESLGARIAAQLLPGDVVLLEGPLGAGKTTLVRGVVAALGGDGAEVASPTFILMETYELPGGAIRRVHHADLYRLRGRGPGGPLDELGLGEVIEDPAGVTMVEWPEEWPFLGELGRRVFRVRIDYAADTRVATISSTAVNVPV